MPLVNLDATVVGPGAAFSPGSNARCKAGSVYFADVDRQIFATTGILVAVPAENHLSGVSNGIHARREGILLGMALRFARRWFFGSICSCFAVHGANNGLKWCGIFALLFVVSVRCFHKIMKRCFDKITDEVHQHNIIIIKRQIFQRRSEID